MKQARTLAILVGISLAAPAWADGAGEDEVSLTNGGMVRGTIISVEPETEVVIQLPGGETRTIPWAEVDAIERGKHAAAPEPPASAPPEPAAPEPAAVPETSEEEPAEEPDDRRTVRIHIESDEPQVQLFRVAARGVAYGYSSRGQAVSAVVEASEPLCTNPCGESIVVSGGGEFFFAGAGVTRSDSYFLNTQEGELTAKVDAGSAGLRTGGLYVTGIGGAAVLGGVIFIVLDQTLPSYDIDGNEEKLGFTVPGAIMLGAGAAVLGGGIAMILTSGTDVEWQKDGVPIEVAADGLRLRF